MRLGKSIPIFAIIATLAACSGGPSPEPVPQEPIPVVEAPPSVEAARAEEPAAAEPEFDPSSIPPQVKMDTMEEVKAFIKEVNQVIRKKDYTTWRDYLTAEYIDYYSQPTVLAEMSESSVLKRQGIVLKVLEDYFLYVVYPSRQSVRVDDIEFRSPIEVTAVTVAPSGDRQIYYYLEKVGDSWKIGTGR